MPRMSFQYVVGPWGPETLVQFLTRRFAYHTHDEWQQLVLEGRVTIDGQQTQPTVRLRSKNFIVYERLATVEPEVDTRFTVIYEDADLLAVEKSGNIPTSPSGKYWDNCLVHVLKRELGLANLHAAHRLDRETSGINLFAKNNPAAGVLGKAFGAGLVTKAYTAVLKGVLPAPVLGVGAPLGKDPASTVHIRQAVVPGGRPSRTVFRLLAVLPGACLVDVTPLTGRTHQIRAHAYHLGHPVWGDKLYGHSDNAFKDWVQHGLRNAEDRQLLHASRLSFQHPTTGKTLTLVSPARQLVPLYLSQSNW